MNKKLRQNFEKAVGDYTKALLKMWELDAHYGYWIGDDMTGVYAYGDDIFINLSDLIYIVDNKVELKDVEEWQEYCVFAHEFNQTIPNLPSWVKGCPRLNEAEKQRLIDAKRDFEDTVKYFKKY